MLDCDLDARSARLVEKSRGERSAFELRIEAEPAARSARLVDAENAQTGSRRRGRDHEPRGTGPDDDPSSSRCSTGATPAGASGNVPMPTTCRATSCITWFTGLAQVNISWWFIPPGKNQSAAERRSSSAVPTTFCVSSVMPCAAAVPQVRTLGEPSTRMRQPSQRPEKHAVPRGRWYFTERPSTSLPDARSDIATGSPSTADTSSPSTRSVTSSRGGATTTARVAPPERGRRFPQRFQG